MRTPTALAAVALTAAALAACGSSSTTASVPGSSAPVPTTSTSASASLACSDLPAVAAGLTTKVHYVALDVGTTNDPSQFYGGIDSALASLQDLTARCTPTASADVAALATSLAAMKAGMTPGTDAAAIATDVALLKVVRADGMTAYRALRLPTAGWENAPENRVAG